MRKKISNILIKLASLKPYIFGKLPQFYTKIRTGALKFIQKGRLYKKILLPFSFGALIVLVPVVYLMFKYPRQVQAQWWDQGGSYIKRQQLNVVNSSAATLHTNTTIAVTVDTKALYNQQLVQADCDDLRVLYQPNNATSTELTRHLVYPDNSTCATSTATKVYFTLQADLASSASTSYYYMYYSNPDATAPSGTDNAYDIGAKDALLVCPFEGTTTCAAGEVPSTESGAVRYGGAKSALSFDGSNDVVAAGNVGSGIQTVEFWVYPDSTTQNFIDLNGSAYISASSGTISATGFTSPTIYVNGVATTTIVAGTWSHVAVTTATSLNASAANIGLISSTYFSGKIDEVRLSSIVRYSTAFTPSTTPFVRDEYTKLLYHFDESGQEPRGHATNVMAMDDSGNSNHGTITGAKYVDGLVGVDGSDGSNKSNVSNGSYGSHEGVFIEEGTTNKITNPSFENSTAYDTNWNVTGGYTLQDEFTDALAAGSVNGTNSEDASGNSTGGTRTVVDTTSKLSITGSQLSVTSNSAWGNPGIWYPSTSRVAGKILVANVRRSDTGYFVVGWDVDQSSTVDSNGIYFVGNTLRAYLAGAGAELGTTSASTDYQIATILRGTGAYHYIKGGDFTNWTLVWISASGSTATLYPVISNYSAAFTADNIRIPTATWLPTPLAYDTFTRSDGAIGSSETTGPDSQTTPSLAWTGGAISSNKNVITPTLGSEAVTNGDMELDANWANYGSPTTNERSNTQAHGGTYSRHVVTDASEGVQQTSIPTTNGLWYYTTAWFYVVSGQARFNMLAGGGLDSNSSWVTTTGQWVQRIQTIRATSSTSSTMALDSNGASEYYADDASVKPITTSSLFSSVSTSDTDVIADVNVTLPTTSDPAYLRSQAGLVTNLDSTSTPANFLIAYHNGTSVRLDKNVGGTYTNLISASATYSAGATLRVITYTSGGSLKVRVYYNNALVGSEQTVSDAGIISNTKHGLFSTYSGNSFDNFTLFPRGTGDEFASLNYLTSPSDYLTVSDNTTAPYVKFGSHSVKLIDTTTPEYYATTINPGNTNTHTLSAYVYDGTTGNIGGTVSSSIAKLVFNGATVTPGYTDMGGGWWRLTYSAAAANAPASYGVEVETGKTIYVDGIQLEEKAYATTYADGTLGSGYAWTSTANNSTSTRTKADILYSAASTNISAAAGTVSFWLKTPWAGNDSILHELFSVDTSAGTLRLYKDTDNSLKMYDGTNTASSAVSWSANTWQYITVDWGSSNMHVYVNTSAGTAAGAFSAPTINTSGYINVGENTSEANHSDATVSEFKIFDSVLSSTEVADLYYAGLASRSDSSSTIVVDRFDNTKGQSPVAVWHMDEGQGTSVNDSTTYLNHLTLSGATWKTNVSNGSHETYLQFDGSNDFLSRTFDQDFNVGTDPFTVSGLFKHPSTVSGTDTILARYGTAGYKIYMNSSGYVCFGIDDDSTWGPDDSACSTVSYADSKWHSFSAVRDTGAIMFYIDGIEVASDGILAATGSLSTNSTLYVGIDSDGTSNPWDGFLDEFIVYPYARNKDQVKTDNLGGQVGTLVGTHNTDNLTDGLVGWWRMEETATPSLDSSGNGNSGTWAGTAAATTGKFGNAISLDGDSDYVSFIPNVAISSARSNITVSLWVKKDANTGYFTSNNGGYISINPNGNYALYYVYPGAALSCSGSKSFATGEWHLTTLTYDGITIKGYLDGVLDCSATGASGNISDLTTEWRFGSRSSSYFDGSIDEVRIYNRALSPAEITQLYEWAPGPVVQLNMDEGSGTSANDSSGNNRTGTLNGNPVWIGGKYGKGVKLDGTEDNISIPDFGY